VIGLALPGPTGLGLLDKQNSFLGKVLLHVAVFGILLIRSSSDIDKFRGLIDEATFYDKQVGSVVVVQGGIRVQFPGNRRMDGQRLNTVFLASPDTCSNHLCCSGTRRGRARSGPASEPRDDRWRQQAHHSAPLPARCHLRQQQQQQQCQHETLHVTLKALSAPAAVSLFSSFRFLSPALALS